MPRLPRLERVGFYHVVNRGVEKRTIFLDDADHQTFLILLGDLKTSYRFEVPAWCLMDNHYHLLVKTGAENISLFMKVLNQCYTLYFNRKYERVGTLWQGRYKSWYVYDEKYLAVLMKYIELNPVRAGLCARVGDFPWASSITGGAASAAAAAGAIDATTDAALGDEEKELLDQFYDVTYAPTGIARLHMQTKPLREHLQNGDRNQGIMDALRDGYRQAQIARELGLSGASISKIARNGAGY